MPPMTPGEERGQQAVVALIKNLVNDAISLNANLSGLSETLTDPADFLVKLERDPHTVSAIKVINEDCQRGLTYTVKLARLLTQLQKHQNFITSILSKRGQNEKVRAVWKNWGHAAEQLSDKVFNIEKKFKQIYLMIDRQEQRAAVAIDFPEYFGTLNDVKTLLQKVKKFFEAVAQKAPEKRVQPRPTTPTPQPVR